MAKQIQAYFRNEDEAEGARIKLQVYNTENLEIGRLQEAIGRDDDILIPLVPWNAGGTGGTTMGTGAVGGVAPAPGMIVSAPASSNLDQNDSFFASDESMDSEDFTDEDFDKLSYVLSVKVRDEDYDEIVHMLRVNRACIQCFNGS